MKRSYSIILAIFFVAILAPMSLLAQVWQWQNPLPTGNPINAVAFADSLHGWFASTAGTILHTADDGETWKIQETGVDAWFEAIDFVDENHGWAIGQIGNGVDVGSVIVGTSDGGDTWQVQVVDSSISLHAIAFTDRNHGFAGGERGNLYITTDGGASWQKTRHDNVGRISTIAFIDSLTGWVDGSDLRPLLVTHNGGYTWTADTSVSTNLGRFVGFQGTGFGWLVDFQGELWRTIDGGKSWSGGPDVVPGDSPSAAAFVDSLFGWVSMAEGEPGLYQTTDGGISWHKISSSGGKYLHFFSRRSGWIGFAKTYDGGQTTTTRKTQFTSASLNDVDFINNDAGWVVGLTPSSGSVKSFIARSDDGGETWEIQQDNQPFRLDGVYAKDALHAWAVGSESTVLKSENGGSTWIRQQLPAGTVNHRYSKIQFVNDNSGWIVGTTVLHTTDGGALWEEQGVGQIDRFLADLFFLDDNTGWVAGYDGNGNGYVYHTIDGGQTWDIQFESSTQDINKLFFLDEQIGWAAGEFIIIKTTDGGQTWTEQTDGVRSNINDLVFLDANSGLICGNQSYYTNDGGETWLQLLHTASGILDAIDFVGTGRGWMVGSNGAILRSDRGITAVRTPSVPARTIDDFEIYPSYPNPFNARTVISYNLSKPVPVRLTIHDLLGREIARLVDGVQRPGMHRVTWDGSTGAGLPAASGLYFYYVISGNSEKSGKMLLIR